MKNFKKGKEFQTIIINYITRPSASFVMKTFFSREAEANIINQNEYQI